MKQLTLFPSPKPLVLRFGEDFFRSAPRSAGVYIMTGEADRVLYIGQSKNLRARLGTYKNARPDCAPRKIVRLVHEVRSIVWEKCDSAEAAKSRESELLRVHRPKFNVAGTWPGRARYFRLELHGREVELDCFPDDGGQQFAFETKEGACLCGPFKASVFGTYAALARLLWTLSREAAAPADYPAGFFSAKPPRPARVTFGAKWGEAQGEDEAAATFAAVREFLQSGSPRLISFLKVRIPGLQEHEEAVTTLPPAPDAFQRELVGLDLEVLEIFGRGYERTRL